MNKLLIIIFAMMLAACMGPNIPRPISDVPIITEHPWVGDYKRITVENFDVKIIYGAGYGELNLYNDKFLVEITIEGNLITDEYGHVPEIEKIYISEVIDIDSALDKKISSRRNVYVYPIVFYRSDKKSDAKTVPYKITVQRIFRTCSWFWSELIFSCRDKQQTITVFHSK
jgi:hypothetical protein